MAEHVVVVNFTRISLGGNANQGAVSVQATVCGECGVVVARRAAHLDWHARMARAMSSNGLGPEFVDADNLLRVEQPYQPLGERFADAMGLTPKKPL